MWGKTLTSNQRKEIVHNMSLEIERKFLFINFDEVLPRATSFVDIEQTYLSCGDETDVECRVRKVTSQTGEVTFTYTEKRKTPKEGKREEDEISIISDQYVKYLRSQDPMRRPFKSVATW